MKAATKNMAKVWYMLVSMLQMDVRIVMLPGCFTFEVGRYSVVKYSDSNTPCVWKQNDNFNLITEHSQIHLRDLSSDSP